jgi:hypothetical protein
MDYWPVPGKKLTRRQALSLLGKGALAYPIVNMAVVGPSCGKGKSTGSVAAKPAPEATDDQFLDQMEQAAFLFFWERANPTTGQVMDRAYATGADDARTVSSIAATGFGLSILCIAAQRGYMPMAQVQERVLTTLDFIWNQLPHQEGFFYHFVDMDTGQRAKRSEVSPIDTSILLCGVLTCRQYFQNPQIQKLATQIYQRVNWPWMLNGGTTFALGWMPEGGFLPFRWDTYSELMMIYLLAIGSPTFPIPANSWDAFARPTISFDGYNYISGNAPLFIHQYSHAWFDFRNKQDAYANYFNNSITATEAHKEFCLSLTSEFVNYDDNLWGLTSSDSQNHGYVAWGGPPPMGPIDGSIVPCAAGGSVPFVSSNCIAVLRNIRSVYPGAWQRYSFVDAFNPLTNWYDPDALGIDLGITTVMAENYRTGFVWDIFMRNPEAQAAMAAVGFK